MPNERHRIFTSENILKNQLFASKLTVDYPLFGGNLMAGAEYTNTHRNDDYIQPENYVPTHKENIYRIFASKTIILTMSEAGTLTN